MDGPSESASALPWLWVIEALAGFREINTSTLQGLIDVASAKPDDFCENTRELVAIRCLEELFGSTHEINRDASSSLDSRVEFDFSRSCEDVLQQILHEIPLSNLKMGGTELLKWDVFPFIIHKRAGTVKCHLEQLKESIFEGTHPYTDYLKERSGLALQNGGYLVHVNDGDCNDLSEKENGNSTYAENMGAKGNSASLILENRNKSSREHLLDSNCLPSKRNRVDSADENLMGYLHEKQVCINESDDFLRNTKKIKCCASENFESKKKKPVSQHGKVVSENSTERIFLISEKGGHHTEQDNRETLGEGFLDDSHGRFTASNHCRSSSHNEVFHDESNIPFNTNVMPQYASGGENCQQLLVESIPTNVALPDENETDLQLKDPNGSQQKVTGDNAQDDTGNGCGSDISGDRIVCQDENLLMKKHEVLIPQCILGHDSLAFTESTEQNLGMKSNEGGQLLVCDATTFPLVVPETCLGMTTTIMPLHTSEDEPCQNTSLDETKDDTESHVEPIPTNVDDANKIQHMNNDSWPKLTEPNAESVIVSQKPVASDKAVVDTVNGCGELSSDSDEYQNEKIDLAAKKHEFLSSQLTFGHDFSASTESTEQDLCMKCNEGGQLLICKTTTCPLMVHKKCLGAFAQFDLKGNFFCPFCTYSHAISEYLEAKKNASLARKELAIFISKGIRHQAAELLPEFHRQEEHSLSRKSSKCEHIHVHNIGNDQLTGCEDNIEDNIGEHVSEVTNLQFERSQQHAPTSCVDTSCREEQIVNNGVVEVLCGEEERGEMLNSKSSTGGRVEENEVPTDHVDRDGCNKFSCKKANIVSFNQSNTGEEIPQEMLKEHITDGTLEPVSAHGTKEEEISEDECEKHVISRYTMRFRKRETQYKPQAIPQLRRKKIPWTAEEEELIREGVQNFGFNDPKIPWKKILAFGSHVFEKDDKQRTPQDLKDKWKNMCRAHSKMK